MSHRVFVTGLGVVSGFGDDLEKFWFDCLAGACLVEAIPSRWHQFADYRSTIWSPVQVPQWPNLFSRIERMQHDSATIMAVGAAQAALTHAGFTTEVSDRKSNARRILGIDPQRCAAFVGSGVGGVNSFMVNHAHQVLASSVSGAEKARLCGVGGGFRASEHTVRETLRADDQRCNATGRI